MNLLINGDFEGGWTDDGNRQIPNGFTFVYETGRVEPEYDDGEPWCVYVQPEMRHLLLSDLPEHEQGLFHWGGETTLKIFKDSGAWKGVLAQVVTLEAGHHVLDLGVYPDAVKSYDGGKQAATDPRSAQIRLHLEGDNCEHSGKWLPMTPFLERHSYEFDFVVTDDGPVNVGVEFRFPHALENSGLFTDGWTLTKVSEPDPEPGKCDCERPRVDYSRLYVVYPDYATLEQVQALTAELWGTGATIGGSYDDAGYGPHLTDITVELRGNKVLERKAEFDAFFADNYPRAKLVYKPLPGEDDPEPDPKPKSRPKVGGWIGVHQLVRQPDGFVELQRTGPSVHKSVNRIDQVIRAFQESPVDSDGVYVFRKYHHDEGGKSFRYNPNKRQAALDWGAIQLPDLTAELGRAGVPTDRVFVQSLNEVWEHSPLLNRHAWEFDLEWLRVIDDWNAQHNTHFRATASTMAVGNPALPSENPAQWAELLPWARALANAGAVGVYHNYGILVKDHPEYLAQYGEWLQNRWMAYFDWLKAHGVIFPWFFGEGGHVVGSVSSTQDALAVNAVRMRALVNGFQTITVGSETITLQKRRALHFSRLYGDMWLNPGQGWNGVISKERAVAELIEYWEKPLEAKNKAENWQAHIGGTPFQGGNDSDWKGFDLAGDPYRMLAAHYGRL